MAGQKEVSARHYFLHLIKVKSNNEFTAKASKGMLNPLYHLTPRPAGFRLDVMSVWVPSQFDEKATQSLILCFFFFIFY